MPETQKNAYLGALSFAGLLVAMFVQPSAGWLSDRSRSPWGRRRPFLAVGTLVALLVLPGLGIAKAFLGLLLTLCLLQLATNIAQGPFQAFIRDFVPDARRGAASGVKNLLDVIGGMTFVALAGYLMGFHMTSQGSHWLWLSLALPAGAIFATMAWTVLFVKEKNTAGEPTNQPIKLGSQQGVLEAKAHPGFFWFLLSRFFLVMALATLQTFGLYFLKDVVLLPNPAQAAGTLAIVIGVFVLLTVYPAGHLSDRFGRKPLILISGILGAAGVLILLTARSFETVLISSIFMGVASGLFTSTNWALAQDLVPKDKAGQYLGLTNFASAGGAGIARASGGLIDLLNAYEAGLGYTVILLGCAIYFILGSLLVMRVRPLQTSH
ncbi:MAG: MFS transporter [Chloroflexi bacterium]|nr:MFS transporter [Chloroflexota bacterium]